MQVNPIKFLLGSRTMSPPFFSLARGIYLSYTFLKLKYHQTPKMLEGIRIILKEAASKSFVNFNKFQTGKKKCICAFSPRINRNQIQCSSVWELEEVQHSTMFVIISCMEESFNRKHLNHLSSIKKMLWLVLFRLGNF